MTDFEVHDEVHRWTDEFARDAMRRLRAIEEARARRALLEVLPRPLHWTIDRPRVLRVVLKLVPRWRPTLVYVAGSTAPATVELGVSPFRRPGR